MTSPCFRGLACCRVSPVCTTAAVVHGLWRDNHFSKKKNYPSSNESLYIIATRQHCNTVLENYKLCGGTSAVRLSPDSGGEERLSTNTRFGRTSSRKQPLLNRQHPLRQQATRQYPDARTHRTREKDGVIRVLIFCITKAYSIF